MKHPAALVALAAIGVVQAFTTGIVLVVGRQTSAVQRWLPLLVSGAAGVLLATACLDLLPEAVRVSTPSQGVWSTLLLSLLVLFCLEALVYAVSQPAAARKAASEASAVISGSHVSHAGTTPLLLGSALHSAVDGVAIAAAFQAGWGPGWSAAFAIALHETPHRLSDFSLLLHKGVPLRRAIQWSILAGAAAVLGGLVVAVLGVQPRGAQFLLPVSAASFLYIALVDLLPELQAHRDPARMWWEVVSLIGGAGLIAAALHFVGE